MGENTFFFKIWMWAVQVLLHLLEYIIIFSHGGLSQMCHTIFNGKYTTYFFHIFGFVGILTTLTDMVGPYKPT